MLRRLAQYGICRRPPVPGFPGVNQRESRRVIVTTEEDVLAALDQPRAIYALQQRLDPSNRSTEALQDQLMRMRAKGLVKFDIKTGKWSKS
jgi:hypothetical protein